ncbi:MAG: adenylosuccinate synthase [Bacteroidota bacterium]
MKIDVLLGLQWGDEGKGKIVDVLTPHYDVIARFQGGPNAGHSLEFNDTKHVLHTIPSGVFHSQKKNVIGNGVVIDPVIFAQEVAELDAKGLDLRKNLLISKKAHLILPSHRILDAANEKAKGKTKIGSTLKGIGPTYMDKTGRNGLRIGDTLMEDFQERYTTLVEKHKSLLTMYDFEYDLQAYEKEWFEGIKLIHEFELIDSEIEINRWLKEGKSILAEGAQGTLLDIDFGSYPFVTSSNTVCAGACNGLGVAPNKVGEVFGIFKAYCTRVGAGPFPTELFDKDGEDLQNKGNEFGATTGRPRRCGWLDLPALKYAVAINGVTQLIITKSDVLSGFDKIKVCTHYQWKGKQFDYLPFEINEGLEPIYKEFTGWQEDISSVTTYEDLPETFKAYIAYLEKELEVPINYVSVGPNRDSTIIR